MAAPPKVSYLFPAGGQRGQTVAVTASGEFSNWPVQLWADRPGLSATCDKDKGKLNVVIAGDATAGVYWLRLYDAEGASSLRPFVVGTLPEALEQETNDKPDQPQSVESKVVVNGKLAKNGDVDGYRVELSEGQTLVASLQGNTLLGSPMDAVLQICELVERTYTTGQTRQMEAYIAGQDHDAIGLDPQLAFTAPKSGPYLVRVFAFPSDPNSTIGFAGGDNYLYRLTLTTGPFLDHVLPLSLSDEAADARPRGWNLPDPPPAINVPASTASADGIAPPDGALAWAWHADLAGALPLTRLEHASLFAADDSDMAQPQAVSLPVTVSGGFEAAGDVDAFAFDARKGDKLRIRAQARSLGFPTDPYVVVLDEADKQIAEADDAGRDQRDPELTLDVPADGRYRLVVRDLHHRGGLRLAYRATIERASPDFSLALAADTFLLEAGKPLEIPVTALARDGFREAIEIRAVGLPDGVTAEPVTFTPSGDASDRDTGSGRRRGRRSEQPASGPSVKLVLTGDPDKLAAGGVPIRIEGRSMGDAPRVRSARFPLNLPLAPPHTAAWLTVKK